MFLPNSKHAAKGKCHHAQLLIVYKKTGIVFAWTLTKHSRYPSTYSLPNISQFVNSFYVTHTLRQQDFLAIPINTDHTEGRINLT